MALDDTHIPITSKFRCLVQIWTREVNIQLPAIKLYPNSASSKWNSWPDLPNTIHSQPSASLLLSTHPSSCLGQMISSHTCFLPFSHTPNLVHQKIMFFYLEIYPKMNNFSMASVLPPWPGPQLSFLLVTPVVFLTVLHTSTFVHAHPNLVSTLQPKKSWIFF